MECKYCKGACIKKGFPHLISKVIPKLFARRVPALFYSFFMSYRKGKTWVIEFLIDMAPNNCQPGYGHFTPILHSVKQICMYMYHNQIVIFYLTHQDNP
jgi:hypothetical protein